MCLGCVSLCVCLCAAQRFFGTWPSLWRQGRQSLWKVPFFGIFIKHKMQKTNGIEPFWTWLALLHIKSCISLSIYVESTISYCFLDVMLIANVGNHHKHKKTSQVGPFNSIVITTFNEPSLKPLQLQITMILKNEDMSVQGCNGFRDFSGWSIWIRENLHPASALQILRPSEGQHSHWWPGHFQGKPTKIPKNLTGVKSF